MRTTQQTSARGAWSVAAALAFSLVLFASQGRAASSPDARFKKASEAYAAGEFADAVYELREIVNEGNFSPGALHNLGDAEWKVGRHGHAVLAWERALSLDPFSKNTTANLRFARQNARVDAPQLTWHERYSTALPGGWWIAIASAGLWGGVALLALPRLLGWRRADWHQGVAAALFAIFLLSGPALFGTWRRSQFGVVLEDDVPLRLTPTREAETLVKLTAGEMARIESDCRTDPRSEWGDYGCRDALAALRDWVAARPAVVRSR